MCESIGLMAMMQGIKAFELSPFTFDLTHA